MIPEVWQEMTRWRKTSDETPQPPEGYEEEEFVVLVIDEGGELQLWMYEPVHNVWDGGAPWEEGDICPLYWSRALEVLPDIPNLEYE